MQGTGKVESGRKKGTQTENLFQRSSSERRAGRLIDYSMIILTGGSSTVATGAGLSLYFAPACLVDLPGPIFLGAI